RDALRLARQVADGLASAHDGGVIHGARCPARVLVTRDQRALVSGFDLGGEVPIGYAAPEQVAGAGADARSDVFALGLLLFELLEGRPFFGDRDDAKRDGKEPLLPRFSRIAPSGVPALVARALRRVPAARPTMAQMRDEIDACLRRLGEHVASARPAVRHPTIIVDDTLADDMPDPEVTAERRVAQR